MRVLACDGNEGIPEGFVTLPSLVYKEDDTWIPEDPQAIARAFSPKNSYFQRCQAKAFCIPDKVRAAAFFDPDLKINNEPVAYFGYFESIGDKEANHTLMAQLESWAKERGAKVLFGPIQFSTVGTYRLRTFIEEGGLPFMGEPQNPKTYPALLEDLGFLVHQGYVTQIIEPGQVLDKMQFLAPLRDSLRNEGYQFVSVTNETWLPRLEQLYAMVDSIFQHNFAYSRPSFETFCDAFGEPMLRKICPIASLLILDKEGAPCAFGLGYPHYGPLLIKGRGADRIPASELNYQEHAPLLSSYPPRSILCKTLGVHQAHRRKRLLEAILFESFERIMAHSGLYNLWYAALIRDDNFSRRAFAMMNAGERTYALYSKRI